jgi:hypothetical protein
VLFLYDKTTCRAFLVIILHVINFLHLLSTLCTHTYPISCILLCCSEEGEYFDEDFFYACETPGHMPMARWCLCRCLVLSGVVKSFLIRYDVITTGYAVYSYLSLYV